MLWGKSEYIFAKALGRALGRSRGTLFSHALVVIALLAALVQPAQAAAPGTIGFSFSAYGNPERPFPGYVGPWQLGPVSISGRGVLRASDGALIKGGTIRHTDTLQDPHYPNHFTTWQVIRGWIALAGPRTTLTLQVQVVGSNLPYICPVGTYGTVTLIADKRRMPNGQTYDFVGTSMPVPASTAPSGGAACGTHVHGMDNEDNAAVEPPRGGPGGGMWANVNIDANAVINQNIIGTWMRVSDHHVVNFAQEGNYIVGRVRALGNICACGFSVGEPTFQLGYAGAGTYTGQVEWRNTSGQVWWQATREDVNGDQMHSEIGDWVRVNDAGGYAEQQPQQPEHQDGGVFYDPPQQ